MSDQDSQEPIELTPEEYAAIDSVTPYKAGKGFTAEEAHEMARKRTKAWMQAADQTTISA